MGTHFSPHSYIMDQIFGVLVLIVAVASASFAPKCKENGQFIANPDDSCSYFQCDYGDSPLVDPFANAIFVLKKRHCPFGTGTAKEFDAKNPCGVFDEKCGAFVHPVNKV